MENQTNTNKSLIWKIGVPAVAILVAVSMVIYTAGFDNFLKLLGIKASQTQTISLTSTAQLLGDSPADEWLVAGSQPTFEGVAALDSYSSIPFDPQVAGLVIPIYSSANESENLYTVHRYISPVIDLGADTPLLEDISVVFHTAPQGSLQLTYRVAASPDALATSSMQPMELHTTGTDVITGVQQLGITSSRYIQFGATFENDTFTDRSAIYEWTISYLPTAIEAAATPATPDDLMNGSPEAQVQSNVVLDFTAATMLPDSMSISVLDPNTGETPVIALPNLFTETLIPIFQLEPSLEAGGYVLVIEADGYETQVVPFVIKDAGIESITVKNFVSVGSEMANFDLNGDGVVNTLDLNELISKIGTQTAPTEQ